MIERYEYVDGKSAKFWEFEATDDALTTRWGRIGTKGQAKTVAAASLQDAVEEGRKAASKKAKKGYEKVTSAGASTPSAPAEAPRAAQAPKTPAPKAAPTPEPPATPAPEASTPTAASGSFIPSITEVEWEQHDRTSPVHPGWGFGNTDVPPWPKPEIGPLWATVRGRFEHSRLLEEEPSDEVREVVERGVPHVSEPALTRELWSFYQDEVPDPSKLSEAAQVAFLRYGDPYHQYLEERVRLHLALFGPLVAFKAFTSILDFTLHKAWGQLCRLPRRNQQQMEHWVLGLHDLVMPIRHALAADSAAHAAAMRYADEAWDEVRILHQPTLILALNDADRARAWLAQAPDVETIIAPDCTYPSVHVRFALRALTVVLPPDQMLPLADTLHPSFLPALLHQHGRAAWPYLESSGAVGHKVLSRMPHPGTMAVSLRSLAERKHTAFLRQSFALQPAIGGEAVRIAVEEPRTRIAALSVAPLTDAAADFAPTGAPATPDALPSVLTSPPWRAKKKALKIRPATLPTLDAPVDITWTERYRGANLRTREAVFRAFDSGWHEVNVQSLLHLAPEEFPRAIENARLVVPTTDLQPLVDHVGLDAVLELASRWTSPAGVACLTQLGHVAVAPAIAAGLTKKTARDDARTWIDRFPEQAAVGLAPLLFTKTRSTRHQALLMLFTLAELGHTATVEAVGARYAEAGAPDVLDAFRQVLALEPTDLLPPKIPKIPDFVHPLVAPPPRLRGSEAYLDGDAYEAACTMLAMSTLEEEYPGLAVLREICTEASLEAFAEGLFESWLANGGDAKHSWCMLALGWFGGDAAVRRLTTLVRRWPGESAAKRAQLGLDVLARIGTDSALSNVYAISQKLKFKSVQNRATEVVNEIASQLGLTSLELGDRVVPDLDLDDDGTATLDFGPRQFQVRLDELLKPVLYEGSKVRKSLPKPNASDDAELAGAAKKRLSALKKDLKTVSSQQIQRLEQMMCTGRAVSAEVFQRCFVEHPLVVNLVRRLVFRTGAIGEGTLFVVDESGQFVDLDDEPVTPTGDVTLPHPVDPDLAAALPAFQERFADYGILQPFEQLARRTYDLEGRRVDATQVSDFGITVPAPVWVHGIERQGWERYDIIDGGGFNAHWWEPGGPESALIRFEGHVGIGYIEADEEVRAHPEVRSRWPVDRARGGVGTLRVRDAALRRACGWA